MTKPLETLVRWRTWIVNLVLAILLIAPEILSSPEVLAIVPAEWQRWVLVAAFLVNILMRPRAAVLPSDPEVDMRRNRIGKGR